MKKYDDVAAADAMFCAKCHCRQKVYRCVDLTDTRQSNIILDFSAMAIWMPYNIQSYPRIPDSNRVMEINTI